MPNGLKWICLEIYDDHTTDRPIVIRTTFVGLHVELDNASRAILHFHLQKINFCFNNTFHVLICLLFNFFAQTNENETKHEDSLDWAADFRKENKSQTRHRTTTTTKIAA